MKKAMNINDIRKELSEQRLKKMSESMKHYLADVNSYHVYVADGNRKTGSLVPSVSLRPILDCGNCSACKKLCYDLRKDCMYDATMETRAKNAAILKADRKRYFKEIDEACKMFVSFRWHIGGDIVDYDYFINMVKIARNNKGCKFLCFTKMFCIVNKYLEEGHRIPRNLRIVFSGWVGQKMDNPFNLPTAHPLFADGTTSARDGARLCTGNCSECLIKNRNCWNLKKGDEIVFPAH